MKKTILILAAGFLMFTACTKKPLDGAQGAAGTNGINGVSSTQSYEFKNQTFYNSSSNTYIHSDTLAVPEITQAVVDNGQVIVYGRVTYDQVAYMGGHSPYSDTLMWHEFPMSVTNYTFDPISYEVGKVIITTSQNVHQFSTFTFKVSITK